MFCGFRLSNNIGPMIKVNIPQVVCIYKYIYIHIMYNNILIEICNKHSQHTDVQTVRLRLGTFNAESVENPDR